MSRTGVLDVSLKLLYKRPTIGHSLQKRRPLGRWIGNFLQGARWQSKVHRGQYRVCFQKDFRGKCPMVGRLYKSLSETPS
jgi:hypothetical protein